jgi:diguanylate cyclase (GGDEF)-like protein
VLTIAVFFVVLGRSVRRAELRPWIRAWLANAGALTVTVAFWFYQPQTHLAFAAFIWAYILPKTLFVLLLASGAMQYIGRQPLPAGGATFAAVAAATGAAAAVIPSIDALGAFQSALVAAVLGTTAVVLFTRRAAAAWLATGLGLRAALAVVEAATYVTQLVPNAWSQNQGIRTFLAAQSSFDTGAEWVIALGCVLTLYRSIQHDLMQSNERLREATNVLQQLADRDPLTGLENRRALPALFRQSYETGATIVFFDLDAFKAINDSLGHHAGDACLKRFAQALRDSFRPGDAILRYAGDEFVVIAQAVEPAQIRDCVDRVRQRLDAAEGGAAIRFSVGYAYLPVHGDGEETLRLADASMYRDKMAGAGSPAPR